MSVGYYFGWLLRAPMVGLESSNYRMRNAFSILLCGIHVNNCVVSHVDEWIEASIVADYNTTLISDEL